MEMSSLVRQRRWHGIALSLIGVCVISGLCVSKARSEDAPGVGDWSFKGAFQRDNGLRGEFILNGSWRFQPWVRGADQPDAKAWLFRNVPGWRANDFFIRQPDGKRVDTWKDQKLTGEERCWQEREFTVPKSWQGRRIVLEFYCARDNSEVYLDGKKLGELSALTQGNFDLPAPIKFDEPYRLTVLTSGIADDVWLRSYPAGNRIEDDYLIPSTRKMDLRLKASGVAASLPKQIRLLIAEDEAFQKVAKQAGFAEMADGSKGCWSLDQRRPWKDPKLWSPEHPNLYWYKLEVLGDGDKVLDSTLPKRLGFREFWIEGGDFFLNGVPFHFRTDLIPAFKFVSSGSNNRLAGKTERFVRETVERSKAVGMNAYCLWGCGETAGGPVFDTFDEMGAVGFAVVSSYRYDTPPDAEKKAKWEAQYSQVIRRYRHHPSLFMYDTGAGSQLWDYCPATLDGSRDPLKDWPEQTVLHTSRFGEVLDLSNANDGFRPVIQHSSAMTSNPVVSTMGYLGFDMDLQERENWPLAWSKVRHKPLFNMEFGMPFESNWIARPTRRSMQGAPLYLEFSAMYFGDHWYRQTPESWLGYLSGKGKAPDENYSPPVAAVRKLFTQRTFLAWRAYGVNLGPFGELRRWFDAADPLEYHSKGEDPRRPGASPDEWLRPNSAVGNKVNELGKVAAAALEPLCSFIGGEESFTRKDHAYVSGEKVTKSLVVINDREQDALVTGDWQLLDAAGEKVAGGTIKPLTVRAGKRSVGDVSIAFDAPVVKQRSTLTLRTALTANLPGLLKDEMTLEVFPSAGGAAGKLARTLYLLDPVGQTRDMLTRAKVPFETVEDMAHFNHTDGVLIVGRHCLENADNVKRLGKDFDQAVEDGLRVIVFEQAAENVLGLRLEETSPRHTFVRTSGHLVVDGIQGGDMIYWRGSSDLIKPYADPLDPYGGKVPPERGTYPLRLWKWGNDNAVATYVIKKPQVGACRALVDCGFGLMETPLMEAARGKGRILFCQLDVTNRYGTDPTATRLVNNLLQYAASCDAPSPQQADPIDLTAEKLDSVKLVPFEGYRAPAPEGKMGWGISAADLFFRDKLALQAVESAAGPSLFAWVDTSGGKSIGTTYAAGKMKTGWQKVKAMIVMSALRINQGGSSPMGPGVSLHGDSQKLYPVQWLEGFVDPYTHQRW